MATDPHHREGLHLSQDSHAIPRKYRASPLIRPNPDWEEDIANTCVVDDNIRERIKRYNTFIRKKKKPCYCQVSEKTGPAPWLKLNDGHEFPAIGLGTWLGFSKSGTRNELKEGEVQRAVEWAIDAGYRHIDTAAIYDTEREVGRAVANKIAEGKIKREDLFITTKLWNDKHARAAVAAAARASLAALNMTYVDLYLIHWPIATDEAGSITQTDYTETWQGMIEARDQGLARSIGVSNFNKAQLERLMSLTTVKPAVLQVEINLNLQQPELLAYCRSQGIVVTGYTPFGSLFPSKAAEDAPPPRVDDASWAPLTRRYSATVPQITLRYLYELGVVPIPKSVTKSRIEQNLDIFRFNLTQADRDLLKSYDRNYRTIPVRHWIDSPYYPFEKTH